MDYLNKDKEVVIYDKMDYNFTNPLCVFSEVKNLKVREVLNGSFTADFIIPLDEKSDYVKADNYVKILGDYFKVRKTTKFRTRGKIEISVACEHVYFEILDDYLPYKEETETSLQSLVNFLNQNTSIHFELDNYIQNFMEYFPPKMLEVTRGNPQATILNALKLWDIQLERNGRSAKFVAAESKEDIQLFRYQKNLSTFNREEITGKVTTRLYAYGSDDITIKGLNLSEVNVPYRISGNKVEFLDRGRTIVIGIATVASNVITSDYLDSRFVSNYPKVRNGEFVEYGVKSKKDLLVSALTELRKLEVKNEIYTLSVEELKYINGDVDAFGLGHQAIIMDEELLSDYSDGKFQAQITEYEFYPFDSSLPSTVKIGFEENLLVDLLKKVNPPAKSKEPEPVVLDCKLLTLADFSNLATGGTYSNHMSNQCIVLPVDLNQGRIYIQNTSENVITQYPNWILDVKGGTNLTSAEQMFRQGNSSVSYYTIRVNLSEMNTKNLTNTKNMFRQVGSKSLIRGLEKLDFRNVVDASGMFFNNLAIRDFSLESLFTSVKNISGMFRGCSNLMIVDLSKVTTSDALNLTNDMFLNCVKLEEANLVGLNFSKVTDVSSMFAGCTNLTKVTLPNGLGYNVDNFDMTKITNMGGMFNGCESLESLNYEAIKCDTHNARNMKNMFKNCKNIKKLDLSSIKIEHSGLSRDFSNYVGMFDGCESLEEIGDTIFTKRDSENGITFPNQSSTGRNVWLDQTFRNTPNWKGPIYIDSFVPTYAREAFVNCGASVIYVNRFTYNSDIIMSELTNVQNNPNQIPIEPISNPPGLDVL